MERVAILQARQKEIDAKISNFGLSETMIPIPQKCVFDGQSVIPFPTGIYNGQTRDGLAHGFGRMEYDDGDVYVGEWNSNHRHGSGWSVTGELNSNSIMYHGEWKDDLVEGVGMMTSGKSVYRGNFLSNQVAYRISHECPSVNLIFNFRTALAFCSRQPKTKIHIDFGRGMESDGWLMREDSIVASG